MADGVGRQARALITKTSPSSKAIFSADWAIQDFDVNLRLTEPGPIANVPIRHFDGLVQDGRILTMLSSQYVGTCLDYMERGEPLGSWHLETTAPMQAWVSAALEAVQIRNPERVFDLYPHEVSGGMGQRVMIAMMLIGEPDVLIADEPTSALDVSVRQQVLSVLEELVEQQELGLIFVSHDLNLVRNYCDRVLVMYAGRVVESLAACDLQYAEHPYTRGLLAALPSMDNRRPRLPVLQRDPLWLTC